MKKNIKKTFLSLAVAVVVLLSGSFTFASSFRTYYLPYKHTTNRCTITYKCLNNDFYNYKFIYYPKYNTSNYEQSKDATKPVTQENPSNSTENKVDTNKEKPVEKSIEKPAEKPAEKPVQDTNTNISNTTQSIELEVVKLVNEERKKAGLAPFSHSEELSKVARYKSQDMADKNYFSHTSPTYGDPFTMMKSFGIKYRTAGENIAKGYPNAKSVVNGWMNSPGHRANILNPSFNKIGVGYVIKNGTTYWTQMFTD